MYTTARTALGLERTKKLITFCFNDRCRVSKQNDFHILLEIVENLRSDDSEAAEEAVAGLHEAAAEAGCAAAAAAAASTAAVARGAPEVALGARVAPPPARSDAGGCADDLSG